MRKSKFTESQIVGNFGGREAGLPVTEICRKHGISVPTCYHWKSKYSGMSINELKCMYTELALENNAIKDVLSRMYNAYS